MAKLPFAEDVKTSFKTNTTPPGIWLDRTKDEIERFGGKVFLSATGVDPESGREAYLIIFEVGGDKFKIVWPILPTRKKSNETAAKIQAASLMHHDIKTKCVSAEVLGSRAAFFSFLMLPDGRSVVEASIPELQIDIPALFTTKQIESGNDFVEGNFTDG